MTSEPVYLRISEQTELPAIDHFRPFRAIVVLDGEYGGKWQNMVSNWLVYSGCLYMMAWGPDCSSWDDSVDFAIIEKHLPNEVPDEAFVMTTWHDKETLEEVFWYAQFGAALSYADAAIEHTLIVHVGRVDREAEFLALYQESTTLAEREADDD